MARIEPRLANPQNSPVELTALVREELAELAPLAWEKDVELILDSDHHCPVETDPVALAIALQNLVTNALNFAPPGSEVRVQVQPQASGAVYISVEDAGPGIDEADYARLFERFYSHGHANGAGLGLAIVQMIVSKVGSTLQLYNLPQGGLCAELRINEKPA
jgi:two-component system sensor histidine kinase QseC